MASGNAQAADPSTAPRGADGGSDADALPDDLTLPDGVAVSYQGIVKPVVDNACLSCHSDGGQAAFRPLSSYAEVSNAIDGMIARTAGNAENPMPPLASETVRAELNKVFLAWRDQGLPENEDGTISGTPEDESGAAVMLAYIDTVKTTIDNACVSCHSEGGQAAQLPLTTYQQVAGSVDAALLRLNDAVSPMPPASEPEQRAQIAKILQDWQALGLPESLPAP